MSAASLWLAGIAVLAAGVFGVSARRDLLGRLIAVEVMVNGALLAAFAGMLARGTAGGGALILVAIAVTVAEAALGLALWMAGRRAGAAADPETARLLAHMEDAP